MDKDQFTLREGKLDVGDGYKLWFMEWGNKDAPIPIFVNHGGPGSESTESLTTMFDPDRNRVIFYDQRGCGKTEPRFKLEDNTTKHLLEDIDKLRKHIGVEKIYLHGGSWGSTLALLYAIEYPEKVEKLLLSGIFLGTKAEIDYKRQGFFKTHFPESWKQYDEIVPEKYKNDTVGYYFDKITGNDKKVSEEHVRRWNLLETTASTWDSDYIGDEVVSDGTSEKKYQTALLETYYFSNTCFLPDNYVLDNAHKISHIPMVLVQGRHDHICTPENAFKLAEVLGEDNCRLHIVPGSHKKEIAVREVIRAYGWAFLL